MSGLQPTATSTQCPPKNKDYMKAIINNILAKMGTLLNKIKKDMIVKKHRGFCKQINSKYTTTWCTVVAIYAINICNPFAEPAQDIKTGCLQTFKESINIYLDLRNNWQVKGHTCFHVAHKRKW